MYSLFGYKHAKNKAAVLILVLCSELKKKKIKLSSTIIKCHFIKYTLRILYVYY